MVGLTLLAWAAFAQSNTIKSVRTWSQNEATRVVLEFASDVTFKHQKISNPNRVFFDFDGTGINLENAPGKKFATIPVNDAFVQNIRIAESQPGSTRVVFDLSAGKANYSTTELANPYRLVVEFKGTGPGLTAGGIQKKSTPAAPPPPRITVEQMRQAAEKAAKTGDIPTPPAAVVPQMGASVTKASGSTKTSLSTESSGPEKSIQAELIQNDKAAAENSSHQNTAFPARLPSRSITRALGLKLNKIVLDPGHGGHDFGTSSRKGLHEKDLVLDIAKRLGALLEDGMAAEVAYTRTDDTFIPLESRTAFANQERADLFISIHANSSPSSQVSGPETFFLNFTSSKDAMDVAARENATSDKKISELQDLVKKITLNEKLTESREFASKVQGSLRSVSSKGKDRGVKRAPFVVLIGADMPSILTEIGFLSNAQEEALLRKTAYRQKIAEALYQGILQYAQTLSHFQVATRDGASGIDAR